MADRIDFELVSPERLLKSEPVEMVVVPGAEGDFGVLPAHAPLISTVRHGVLAIYEGGRVRERIFVGGGFAEVTPERCTVLADEAVPVDDIDRARLEERLNEARRVAEDPESDEAARTIAANDRAVAESMLAFLDADSRRSR